MKSILVISALAWALIGSLLSTPAFAQSKLSVSVLPSSGPRTLVPIPQGVCKRNMTKSILVIRVKITGIKKLVPIPTRKPLPGDGAIEVFHDSIPAAAYKQFNSRRLPPNFLLSVPSTSASICVALPFFRTRGRHVILVALAQTTGVLYSGVEPARFTIRLK